MAWTSLCRLAFLSLSKDQQSEFFNVRDLFIFLEKHWNSICHLEQLKKKTWKKSILDALNHSDYFQSGINQYHTNGYWKLTDTTIPNIKNRKCKRIEPPSSPYKTALKSDDEVYSKQIIPKESKTSEEYVKEFRDVYYRDYYARDYYYRGYEDYYYGLYEYPLYYK